MMRVVKHWCRLLREVLDSSSLKTFKTRLDWALTTMPWLKMSQLIAKELDWKTLAGLSNPNHSVILQFSYYQNQTAEANIFQKDMYLINLILHFPLLNGGRGKNRNRGFVQRQHKTNQEWDHISVLNPTV